MGGGSGPEVAAIDDCSANLGLAFQIVDDILDVEGASADLGKTLHGTPADEVTVLLAHEPDFVDEASRFPVDLQLSGHSHGGQVRIPFIGPLYLPPLARKYPWGMYRVGALTLYTNPGLGTVGPPFRWNCPPEITLLTLRHAPASS